MTFHMNISGVKSDIKNIILTIEKLHQYYEHLKSFSKVISEEEFDEIMRKFQIDQNILNNLLIKYENNELQKNLRKKLNNRAKKRMKINLRHKTARIKKRNSHVTVDEYLSCRRKEINETANKEKLCKQIKHNLSTLKRKIDVAKRRIREIESQCVLFDENKINIKTTKLLKSWYRKLNGYIFEETALKKALSLHSQSVEDQWNQALFGNKQHDRKLTNFKELSRFFEIRKIWDSYLVTAEDSKSSPIPFGWVFPPENPTKQWAEHLFKDYSILNMITSS